MDISNDTAIVGAWSKASVGIRSGAAYIFERDSGGPHNWGEVIKLIGSDTALGDNFGGAVGIDGDTAIVGAEEDDDAGLDSGSAYLFERGQGGPNAWGEVAKLTASDAAAGDLFGWDVAIAGDLVIVVRTV